MVQKRERYIVGWTPRVNGYSPGKLSLSKYDSSALSGAIGEVEAGNPIRGNSMPEEVSKRSLRSLNLSNDLLRAFSCHFLYCSLIVIGFTMKCHKGSRRQRFKPLCSFVSLCGKLSFLKYKSNPN